MDAWKRRITTKVLVLELKVQQVVFRIHCLHNLESSRSTQLFLLKWTMFAILDKAMVVLLRAEVEQVVTDLAELHIITAQHTLYSLLYQFLAI